MEFKKILYLPPNIGVNEVKMLIQLTEIIIEEQKVNFFVCIDSNAKTQIYGLVLHYSDFVDLREFSVIMHMILRLAC